MEALLTRQREIYQKLHQFKVNLGKDSAGRKTPEYIKARLEAVNQLWNEFLGNDARLAEYETESQPYYAENVFGQAKLCYDAICKHLCASGVEPAGQAVRPQEEARLEGASEVSELLRQQRTNFRAFQRLVKGIKVDAIVEKWEFDDKLQSLQSRWASIDKLHLQIDNSLQGSDRAYDDEFVGYEDLYEEIKRSLHTRLGSVVHRQQATPQLEIPVFAGSYTQWPTFFDLFREAVHKNASIQKAQKMQHLKGKLTGEAERLIQHLNISSENYDVAWELLTRRYNNLQLLFSKQMESFLNQPAIHKQCSEVLKRLHDTSAECINAIRNLGIDTSSWGPILVHLLLRKMDQETCSDFKEFRKSPREVPTLEEFMGFLEIKFTALEPIIQEQEKEEIVTSVPKRASNFQGAFDYRPRYHEETPPRLFQVAFARVCKCLLCNHGHELFKCRKFIALAPENRFKFVTQNKVCENCLYTHYGVPCSSRGRCRECGEEHNTLLHSACSWPTGPLEHTPHSGTASSSKLVPRSHNVGHVARGNEEVLLTTASLKVQAQSGEFIILRALLDQGSQVSLMSENAAQLLGLRRHSYHASIAGIGDSTSRSRGMVMLKCQSIHDDYQFATNALVIARAMNNLPNVSFDRQAMPNISNINLADPEYNVSRPVDLLLNASVYSGIVMHGLIRHPEQNIIARQTRLGWVLSGNVRTFNCHVVLNNVPKISKVWQLEDDTTASGFRTSQEPYGEDFYQRTTSPMKTGLSKPKAAQYKKVENKLQRKRFVANRAQQVTSVIEPASWYHVRAEDNAADCAARGLTSAQLAEQEIRWEGPERRLQFKHDDIGPTCYEVPQLEVQKFNVHAAVFQDDNVIANLLNRHESITRVVRTLAWVSRFITQARSKLRVKRANYLTPAEVNGAYDAVSKYVQGDYFNEEIASLQKKGCVRSTSRIFALNPFLDNKGLLRVGSRLANTSISEAAKHAVILPNHGRLAQHIIEQGHKATLHGGARFTLSYLRNKYWIMDGMRSVKRVLRQCGRCRRFEANTRSQMMADLPASRVTSSRTFEQGRGVPRDERETPPSIAREDPQPQRSRRGSSLFKSLFTTLLLLATLITPAISISITAGDNTQGQINSISGQFGGDLALPIHEDNIRDIYRLSTMAARAYNSFLIIEIRLPIVSSDMFDMDKMISVSRKKGRHIYEMVPIYPYFALNLQKVLFCQNMI